MPINGQQLWDLRSTIAHLKRTFPDAAVDYNVLLRTDGKEAYYKAGQVSVVRHLESVLEELEEAAMESKVRVGPQE